MDGLIIKKDPLDKILDGKKTWEIRGSKTSHLGKIALIESGSGTVVGSAEIVEVIGPLNKADFMKNLDKHGISSASISKGLRYKKSYAWVLKNAKKLKQPRPYTHPKGAVIWVKNV